ncbi:3-hydroxyacyl-CoA dehydrogenase NAD-binding domain-containing protein [Rubritalea marina]|uniref:3-hydroxyacyl-CoA dehydrogenase NAD-binding domain-containing protein n=1 Tax=Rubritalea marina TaxID=361055 RepID=UPI000362ABE1|nr:3-hydroxyacyl-CoA dehydrogenase NAD-binding domain-containing protein [Rubritalea marina]
MHFKLTSDQYIATLTFDRAHTSANTFNEEVLLELESIIDGLKKSPMLNALIIVSAKPNIFIAGADLNVLADASEKELDHIIRLGQRVFRKIEQLHITTIAAIHGACVGGGYELALACDYRIATNAPSTKLGLPETKLGILPAWGGTTRLPELIGLSAALPLILGGTLLPSKVAKKRGLIDSVCFPEQLNQQAHRFTKKPKRRHRIFAAQHNILSLHFIKSQASKSLYQKTRGHYPALLRALDVACKGVLSTKQESFDQERRAIIDLAQGIKAKNLIQLYFATERHRKLRIGNAAPLKIERSSVIGAGIMGSGIAHWIAKKHGPTLLKDVSEEALAKGMANIEKLITSEVKSRRTSQVDAAHCFDRITATTEQVSLRRYQLIIEAATENFELKQKIFTKLETQAGDDTILATNTSALPVTQLADSIKNPKRLIGIHFFNPVSRMPLVEIVKTKHTDDATLNTALCFVQKLGKFPVVVNDSPGFVVNRILLPYLVRAGELFEEGHAPELIDEAMLDFGMPMGPLRLIDTVGIDVAVHVATTLATAYPDRMRVPKILTTMHDKGLLGKKSGSGFYHYRTGKIQANTEIQPGTSPLSSKQKIQDELAALMSNEAQRCLNEGIAESAADIDFAMVMGTGYPPFRGGPLTHATTPS